MKNNRIPSRSSSLSLRHPNRTVAGETTRFAGGCATIVTLAELRESAPWREAFHDKLKDHRFYELISTTLTADFEYFFLVLEDDDRRAGERREEFELLAHAGVDVAAARRGVAAEGRRAGVAHHRRKFWKIALDAAVHVALVAGPHVEQLDHIADGGRIELAELFQYG